jgi:ABC-2 type transport system ATP-binding protein
VVGIIERGRLVAVGTVEEIRRQARQTHNLIEVRLLDNATALGDWLNRQSDVSQLQVNGDSAKFLHAGSPEAEAVLLRAMIEAGFRVTAFGSQQQTLEDAFMHVTKGLVQ